ncbi:unnamed protein product [Brassica oleracea var. botrytis]
MGSLKRKSSWSSKTLAKSKKRKGPHLPNSILKMIATHKRPLNSDDNEIYSDLELYEYEEGIPEEESRKNNRYGRLDSYEFKLPDDFEDEDVESEDDEDCVNSEYDDEEDRHTRMLQALTGMPSAAFNSESKSKPLLFTEPYPEGEFNPTRDVLSGKNILTEEDFLAPLEGHHKTSKQISRMRKDTYKSVVHPPLPKPERERLERKAARGLVDEEFSKWVHLVKRNREAPTVYFSQEVVNLGKSTVGAIASEFQPRTEFEMRMASVLNDNEVSEAHREDGARLLELNQASSVSMEDHIKDHSHIAKWENSGGAVKPKKTISVSGGRVFGATEAPKESKKDSDNFYDNNSDSDIDDNDLEDVRDVASPARRNNGTILISGYEESENSESEAEQMVDGLFEVPSQAELINRAFAGDDVVGEFEKEKQEVLNQEVPEPEKPVLLPGWGQPWPTNKRGYHQIKTTRKEEDAQRKREEALKTRKDFRLKHVIISEKVDKKAEKLHTVTPPFPFTSKEVFEHSMRMPIGPEFNPSTVVGDLNRPEIVKKTGVIIKPVKFEEVNPNEEVYDEHPRNHQKPRLNKKTSRR